MRAPLKRSRALLRGNAFFFARIKSRAAHFVLLRAGNLKENLRVKHSPLFAGALCAFCLVSAEIGVPEAFAASVPAQKSAKASPEKKSGASGGSAKAKPAGTKADAAKPAVLSGRWDDPDKYQKELASKISANFKEWKPAEAEKFLKEDANRSLLARWELLRQIKKEDENFKTYRSFAKKSDAKRFLSEFSSDADWIEGYLYTATPKNTLFAMQMLKAFADRDPEVKTNPTIKKIATGVAGEFSRRDWLNDEFENDADASLKNGPTRIYKRFKFFADSWREKRLNVLFDNLDYWDTRIVVGTTGRTNNIYFGSEESLRWGQDNVKLPEAGYASPRDIFQMPYRLWNKVGDSVHVDDYYSPFRAWYKRLQLKMAREVGCVCGGVSHYGATAACANGIPGVTMGEPGHCAFAVRVQGKWRDNNSVSWDRTLHWRVWDETAWTFLHLTQAVYENKKDAMQAFRLATLARLAGSGKKPRTEAALAFYEAALEKQPLNFPVWRDYLEFAKKQKIQEKDFWKTAYKKIIAAFASEFPEAGAVTLCKYVYPNLLPLLGNDDEKTALYAAFWEKAGGYKPARWDVESVWQYEISTLGSGGAANYSAFRKNYDAEHPGVPGSEAPQQRYKEKVGAAIASKKNLAEDFENWKKGTPRK